MHHRDTENTEAAQIPFGSCVEIEMIAEVSD